MGEKSSREGGDDPEALAGSTFERSTKAGVKGGQVLQGRGRGDWTHGRYTRPVESQVERLATARRKPRGEVRGGPRTLMCPTFERSTKAGGDGRQVLYSRERVSASRRSLAGLIDRDDGMTRPAGENDPRSCD